jgi:electron transport complex protein RnfG
MTPAASLPPAARLIRVMTLVSLACGLLIVVAHQGTREPIRRNQAELARENVALLVPGGAKQLTYLVAADGGISLFEGDAAGKEHFVAVYAADGDLRGVVWSAGERGYADMILGMFAYDPGKEIITGFRAVEMKETPGLGDKINTDPEFQANFRALDARSTAGGLVNPIRAVKHGSKKHAWEIDAISGATISSRAVGRMLDRSAARMAPIIRRNLERIQKGQ